MGREVELLVEKKSCVGCGNCSVVCKMKACTFSRDQEGYYYPTINEALCISCKACINVCPVINHDKLLIDNYRNLTYSGYLKDQKKLLECASGGAATAIAEMFLKSKGVIYGVAYSSDFTYACHVRVDSINELSKLKGSKYIQSRKNFIFNQVLDDLKKGIQVCFFGVPCEIAALKAFLKTEFANLTTCELICQGTMSEIIQEQFIERLECIYQSKVVEFSARSKKLGWIPPYIFVKFANDKEYCKMAHFTDYGEAHELMLRPSCYNCEFKGEKRVADITIGDGWGVQKDSNQWNNNGTSVVISHTDKGNNLIQACTNMCLADVDYNQILIHNPMLENRWSEDKKRASFAELMQQKGLHYACKRKRNRKRTFKCLVNRIVPDKIWVLLKNIKN